MFYKLEKPDLTKIKKENAFKSLTIDNKAELFDFIKKTSEAEYLYWDKFQYKEPFPKNITKEEVWFLVKFIRESQAIKTIIKDKNGKFFSWNKLTYFEEFFHELDMNTGGELFVERVSIEKGNKQKLITRGIMEEAIASSQLEGAATSRQAAKKMLREGRSPRNSSEQMIVNNYLTMKMIEDDYKDKKMSLELLKELHHLITKNTFDSENEAPRLRKNGDPIYVSDDSRGFIYHEGPDMEMVETELERLIQFANDETRESFIHPVIKAIMLHFWIGYLHPFTDGNGRLARLLFYWYLLRKNYWAFAYLPISKVIKKSPQQYIMAYVYSEQDNNDLTYFIDYNIKKIKLAVNEFQEYLEKKSKENLKMKKTCEEKYELNIRQVQLLQFLFGDREERTSLMAHTNINQITKKTASKDLKDLVAKGFLTRTKKGRSVYYHGTEKIKELF